jgi:hypothetical protein
LVRITAGQSIQQVLDTHTDESEFVLEQGIYNQQINFDNLYNKHLLSEKHGAVEIICSKNAPYAVNIPVLANSITLSNLTIKSQNKAGAIVGIRGKNTTIINCDILGDPINGQHRGIEANGDTILIQGCKIDNCFLQGQDAQAICGWTGPKNVTIDACYLGGGAQSVMFGGGNPASMFDIPTNIKLINSTLTKSLDWYKLGAQIKCSLELKNCMNFYSHNCSFQYAGVSQGHGAFLIVLTPRDDPGKAPYTCIKNVVIEHFTAQYGGGCISFLGSDTNHPTDTLENVVIQDGVFDYISHLEFTLGSGRILQFEKAPRNITLSNLTIRTTAQLKASAYFMGLPPINLAIKNINFPKTKYGFFVDNVGMGLEAVRKYCPSLVTENMIINL